MVGRLRSRVPGRRIRWWRRGYAYGASFSRPMPIERLRRTANSLERYFDEHATGPGIWKLQHYFEIYERHLGKFVGREVHAMEIGVYSGGSLQMWREYFGADSVVYGTDIEPACRAYESENVRIFIGDQADSGFWDRVMQEIPALDVVIDDGGHLPEQQAVTLEALLPIMRPGGVYICEDVHGPSNAFHSYIAGLASHLHTLEPSSEADHYKPVGLQLAVSSIHLYPSLVVIELHESPPIEFVAAKQGTEWQPFYDR
jgi:Methyltransferase domain